MKAIVYTSNTGHTAEYSKMLGAKIGLPVYALNEAAKKLQKGTEIMFPNVKGVIASFDYTQKKLVVTKEKFREVCDYEN